jgi:hypothetical protein
MVITNINAIIIAILGDDSNGTINNRDKNNTLNISFLNKFVNHFGNDNADIEPYNAKNNVSVAITY